MISNPQNSSRRLENKVAIITGASSGIGAAAARLFAREGATVVLAARREEALIRMVREIQAAGGQAMAVKTDVQKQPRWRLWSNKPSIPMAGLISLLTTLGATLATSHSWRHLPRNLTGSLHVDLKASFYA